MSGGGTGIIPRCGDEVDARVCRRGHAEGTPLVQGPEEHGHRSEAREENTSCVLLFLWTSRRDGGESAV